MINYLKKLWGALFRKKKPAEKPAAKRGRPKKK